MILAMFCSNPLIKHSYMGISPMYPCMFMMMNIDMLVGPENDLCFVVLCAQAFLMYKRGLALP